MKQMTGYPNIDKTHLKGTTFLERHPIIPSLTFSQVMDTLFFIQGEHNIVDCLNLEVNSKEFQKDSLIVAKALLELGIKEKDIVSVSMPNYYQAIPVFKATNMLGAVTTYFNPLASIEEVERLLNFYESKIFICSDRYNLAPYYDEIRKNTKVEYIVTMQERNRNSRDFNQEQDYLVGNSDNIDFHELERVGKYNKNKIKDNYGGKQDALILYTSGSTGQSKSLLYTNENLISSCIYLKNSTHVPKVTPDDCRWMNVVPFMYPYGFGASVLQTFLSGREVILTPNLGPDNISYYYGKNPNLVFGSPAHLALTEKYLPKEQKLPGLKIYLSGGDYLSVSQSHDAIDFFKGHGAKNITISNSSGTGETMGCSTNAMNVPYRPETVGQLVVGPDYLIIDPVEYEKTPSVIKEVKYGEVGILCTSGKHVFKGYFKRPELTDEVMFNYNGKKYYATGNIGFLDKDRYFTLIGRASRFFIVNTFNKVYCELVQLVVSNIKGVESCAVVPKKDDNSLYVSKAYVVLKDGYLPTKEMADYIISESRKTNSIKGETITLKDYEVPASVTFLDSLPRTNSAEKINYELLKEMAEKEYEEEKGKIKSRQIK